MRSVRTLTSRRLLIATATAVLASTAAASWAVTGTSSAGGADRSAGGWVASYAGSPVAADTSAAGPCSATRLDGQTVRDVVYSTVAGDAVRVRISNAFGGTSLTVGHASVAVSDATGAAVPGTPRPLTFGGLAGVTVAAGSDVLSDPVRLAVPPLHDLAVSVYLPSATGPLTQHADAQQLNLVAPGDAVLSASTAPFTTEIFCSPLVSDVDVRSAGPVSAAVVAFGDSITDGYQSTGDANRRWPNLLAADLATRPGNDLTAIDAGITGNELTADRTPVTFGVSALARLDRDVLVQTGARYVVLLEGINDIGALHATAAEVIAADQQIIAQAHAVGLRIYGGTLTPFAGSNGRYGGDYGSAYGEAQREAVNAWIRGGGAFDGVIDFDRATRDPADPQRFLPAYDSGDHLHPGDAGYRAMAQTALASLPVR